MTGARKCIDCRWWGHEFYVNPEGGSQGGMACKRYAPRAGAVPAWREADDWCGEFEAKPEALKP